MATYAIIVDDPLAGWNSLHGLWLPSHGKYIGVPKPIRRLEVVFAENIIVRHVAIVASGVTTVRAMQSRGVVGVHHVAIDASSRVIA